MQEEKTLTTNQRRLLQMGVVVLLVIFMIGFFFFQFNKNKKEETTKLKNTTVYIQDDKLQIFDDVYTFIPYPDKLNLHYPYLILVKTGIQTTYIYNLEQKKKEKEVKEILLDYTNGNQLYTKGKTTLYNNQDLGVLCEKGFIKSPDEILCVTKYSQNSFNYKLVSISPQTKVQKDVYTSEGILTDVKVINNQTYLGEIMTLTKNNRIVIDNKPIESPNIISLIYMMSGRPYFASFKSVLNHNTESYYLIDMGKVVIQGGNRVYLYK